MNIARAGIELLVRQETNCALRTHGSQRPPAGGLLSSSGKPLRFPTLSFVRFRPEVNHINKKEMGMNPISFYYVLPGQDSNLRMIGPKPIALPLGDRVIFFLLTRVC